MSLDDQLAELLATLGVELEGSALESPSDSSSGSQAAADLTTPSAKTYPIRYHFGRFETGENAGQGIPMDDEIPLDAPSELSLFQTSREHYGVFYRLDLSQGVPHLRIFLPDEDGCLKMGCYLVRAAPSTPLHQWFVSTREHAGSDAYNEIRDTAHQHLLFAAGELMKRLFWTGSIEEMSFPSEIEVLRLV